MFGLGIDYLMGWAMAAQDGARKERPEWPPHPDRIYMALAAAWFETGKDELEGAALKWIEGLGPPSLTVSPAGVRRASNLERPTISYVPVNDTRLGPGLLPEARSRQPRSFPVALPTIPTVFLSWTHDLPEEHVNPLQSLCQKVISIGHSASLVRMWLTEEPPQDNLHPVDGFAKLRLRVMGPGRLEYLETQCNREAAIAWADMEAPIREAKGEGKKVLLRKRSAAFPNGRPMSFRPEPSLWQGYSDSETQCSETVAGSIFDSNIIILSLSGGKLYLPTTLKLTEALGSVLLKLCPAPIPEWLTGHAADGSRTSEPHLAIFPLPFAGSKHADGRIMGLALAIPRGISPRDCARVLDPCLRDDHGLARRIRLFDGQWLECAVELDCREAPPWNLRPETWTGPSRVWSTVTPVVLDRHFNGKGKWDKAAESLKDSCEHIGLPRPLEAMLHPVSLCEGAPRSNQFPWLTRKRDGGRMHHAHAVITFKERVQGPVAVGAGRFRGYGFCRPLAQGGEDHA